MKTMFYCGVFIILICGGRSPAIAQDSTQTSGIQIVDAKLGKEVSDRMLTGEDSVFSKDSKVFLWMKLTGASQQQITVTWKSGEFSHPTTLLIGGSPWRTWASKTVSKAGDWTVTVSDSGGTVLREMNFKVE